MDDLISRQAAMEEISKQQTYKMFEGEDTLYLDANDVGSVLASMPSAQSELQWIPCSERVPEDRRTVLVTAYWHETYQVMMASCFGDGLWWCVPYNNCGAHTQKLKPKAWMPLPEPYKEDE